MCRNGYVSDYSLNLVGFWYGVVTVLRTVRKDGLELHQRSQQMIGKRRNFTPEFKSDVAVEALKEELTVAELAKKRKN